MSGAEASKGLDSCMKYLPSGQSKGFSAFCDIHLWTVK